MKNALPFFGFLVFVAAFVASSLFYRVNEGQQVIITQFGRPIGDPVLKAGLHIKMPFIQDARRLEKRMLNWDGVPNEFPTKDKKLIMVDTTARWLISHPLRFIEKVKDERGAISRITTVLDAATREIISNYNLVEAVRNSNDIIDEQERRRAEIEKAKLEGRIGDILDEEITGEIERVYVGREELSQRIATKALPPLEEFGIQLVDVQLRRIAYHPDVEAKVYDRMISERKRIAKKIRSYGKGEQARIYGNTEEERLTIESGAYKEVQQILGEAEGTRTEIYSKAYTKDAKFYEFYRTLEAYKKSLRPDTNFLMSSDSEFLKVLKEVP